MQIREWFGHFCRSVLRMYQQPYSHEWDKQLNQLIDKGAVTGVSAHTLTIRYAGTYYEIWTSNRWYAFGHLYRHGSQPAGRRSAMVPKGDWRRPRFRTMQRLWEVYESFSVEAGVFRG